MPIYCYKCPSCGKIQEVMHTIKEIDNPSHLTIKNTSCNPLNCDNKSDHGIKWCRVPQPFFMLSDNLINNENKRNQFKKSRETRNLKHFQDEVYPTLPEEDKSHFKKRWGYKS